MALKVNMSDLKRNNKVCIRNFTEPNDLHDIIKLMLVRMLRRKHPYSLREPIYTEYDPEKPLEDFPDIWMKLYSGNGKTKRAEIYVWEIQRKITKEWRERMNKQYEQVTFVEVPVEEIEESLKNCEDPIEKLRELLEEYIF